HDCDGRARHDAGGVLALGGLAVEVGHGAGMTGGKPPVELGTVLIGIERSDSHDVEPYFQRSTLHLHGLAGRLRLTPLLDVVRRHSPIVSRRQRAKFTTSSTGGIASSSP